MHRRTLVSQSADELYFSSPLTSHHADERPSFEVKKKDNFHLNVDISVIFPNAHTVDELYGTYKRKEQSWESGQW